MKKISIIAALLISVYANAQKTEIPAFPTDDETGLVTYSEVIQVPGISDDSLYTIAMKWIKDFYKMPTMVIKSQDKEAGKIEIYTGFQLTRMDKNTMVKAGQMRYTLTLQFKDGRFKYTITKINLEGTTYFGMENWLNDEKYQEDKNVPSYLTQIDEYMNTLVESIESEIQPKAVKKEDDW